MVTLHPFIVFDHTHIMPLAVGNGQRQAVKQYRGQAWSRACPLILYYFLGVIFSSFGAVVSVLLLIEISSTSKISVALGPICPPAPRSP